MDVQALCAPGPPYFHLLVAGPSETWDLAQSLRNMPEGKKSGGKKIVRIVRSAKSRTLGDLFDEIGAALQFPYYFGENWAALDECLADLDWLPEGAGDDAVVLLFTDAMLLLCDAPPREFRALFHVLDRVARGWSHGGGETTPTRLPRAFHLVFQCSSQDELGFLDRVQPFGIALNRLV